MDRRNSKGQVELETKPDPIPASEIKQTVDTEVLVIGVGLAGTCSVSSSRGRSQGYYD